MKKNILLPLFLFAAYVSVIAQESASPKYEFRGVWIATVDNIE